MEACKTIAMLLAVGVFLALSPAAAQAGTTPYVSYDGNLVLTSGGDLYNPSVPGSGGSMTGRIGSNTADRSSSRPGSTRLRAQKKPFRCATWVLSCAGMASINGRRNCIGKVWPFTRSKVMTSEWLAF